MENHVFSDREGLRIAEEMERRGEEFYRHAARISKTEETIALLGHLADDERLHRQEFHRLFSEAHGVSEEAYAPETSAYLSAIAADIVFAGGLMELGRMSGFDSPEAILRYAIGSEKDSILFYFELQTLSCDEDARKVFGEIIRQEKAHLSRLQKKLAENYQAK